MNKSQPAPWERNARIAFAAFLFIPVALFLMFYVIPVIETVRLSFQSWNGLSPRRIDVGMQNYVNLLNSPRFYHSLANNVRWLIFYVIAPTGLGLALALLADRLTRGQTLFKLICFLPYTLPPVAVAAIWRWMYEPSAGFVTRVLDAVGLEFLTRNWIGDAATVTYSLMFASLWWSVGFSFIVFFAGIKNLPLECLEAARMDGASAWQTFSKIIFPLLWPSTAIALGMSSVDAMRLFDIVWAMTNGGPAYASDVLATQMYDTAFGRLKMGEASAISVAMLLISACVVMPFIIYMARQVQRAENDH